MVPEYAVAVIAAGDLDRRRHQGPGFLDIGVAAFRAALRDAGVADEVIHFELLDAPHMGIDYRYPLSPRWLCQRISP